MANDNNDRDVLGTVHAASRPRKSAGGEDEDLLRQRRRRDHTPARPGQQIMGRVARAGGNPRRLPSALPGGWPQQARPPSSGRFNAHGRGAKVVARFPRDPAWSVDPHSGQRVRSRRATVKVRIVKGQGKAGGIGAHLRYIERDGVSRSGERGRLYSTFTDAADRDAFVERGLDDRHQFRVILSPEDGAAYEDLRPFTRDVMAKIETDLDTTLDWVAVHHFNTGHPHVHVVVRGVMEDGRILNTAGDYLSYGIRHRAGEVLTRDLGPQTEQEVQRQLEHEVEAERLTSLDRTLIGRAEGGVVDLRDNPATAFERVRQQLLIGRARQLERMDLATQQEPLRWSLRPDMESVLRTMGERGDIIKTMHRALAAAKLERPPHLYTIHDRDAEPIVGRVIARGLDGDDSDRRYLVVDGIDGRSHYVDIGEAEGSFPAGAIVRIENRAAEPRQVDRTIAAIATANGGRYNVDIHLRHDRHASEAFAVTHVRRLEAIRRATGAVERDAEGTWTIAPDHLDRVGRYEQRLVKARPVAVVTLSTVPIERQVGAEGATWLDRQLVREVKHERAGDGFGRDVHQALVRRQQWLIDQRLMQRDGTEVVFREDPLPVLEQRELRQVGRELAAKMDQAFIEPLPGLRVEGVYRRAVDLASGRYAVIEKARDFTLVPWRPVLERHLGRAVSGVPQGDGFDWRIGRKRDGPAL